jgi:glycogen debranching enzyme
MSKRHRLPNQQPHNDEDGEVQFHVTARKTGDGARRTLKYGDSFLIVDRFGDIGASTGGADGLFHEDTRFLSYFQLLINDQQPLLLGCHMREDNSLLSIDLTNPDFEDSGKIVLHKDVLQISRNLFLWRGTVYQRLAIKNHGQHSLALALAMLFRSDFVDLFEVRGMHRSRRGTGSAHVAAANRVTLSYTGLDNVVRNTTLSFDPTPTELLADQAVYKQELMPGQTVHVFAKIKCDHLRAKRPDFCAALIRARRELREETRDTASVETSNEMFNAVLRRSAADLNMLVTDTAQGPYPYAGIPWFSTTFGRDGLITAMQMLWYRPDVALGVLRRLAAYQATSTDPQIDADPGKILHEMRAGEMANLHEVPFGLYYGSVDTTPLFVLLAALYARRTGDLDSIAALWPAIEAALGWIDGSGDADGDGFVEYKQASKSGLSNQGWKDSGDAIFHADGQLAEGAIALAEVQGYVFAAKTAIADCARRLGRKDDGRRLKEEAHQLAQRFEEAFWCAELGTYALALDGNKKPCRVRTSNAGQLLFSEMIRPDRARCVAQQLMQPEFFTGWGIRTLASGERRFNPMSYHNGSVWPHDNALIGLGMTRYGLKRPVVRLFQGLFDAASYMDLYRLPELFCGFARRPQRGPTLYPVACSPQAWSSATPFTLLEACLGLEINGERCEIRTRNPALPPSLEHVVLRNVRLADSSVDIKIRRQGDNVSVQVLDARGRHPRILISP